MPELQLSKHKEMFSEALSLHGSLLLIDSSFLKQGVVYGASQCVSGRILLTCTWYFVIIVFSMYVANLAAYFTGTSPLNLTLYQAQQDGPPRAHVTLFRLLPTPCKLFEYWNSGLEQSLK